MRSDKYSDNAINNVREYIWENIINEELLDPDEYYADGFTEHLVPIIPSQQIPEFNNLLPGRTYLIYDFETRPIPPQWWMVEEVVTITVVSQNYEKVVEITSFLQDLFRRYDDSAIEVNNYFDNKNTFMFHYINVESVLSPAPFDEEGAYQMGSASIAYVYSRRTDASGRF